MFVCAKTSHKQNQLTNLTYIFNFKQSLVLNNKNKQLVNISTRITEY